MSVKGTYEILRFTWTNRFLTFIELRWSNRWDVFETYWKIITKKRISQNILLDVRTIWSNSRYISRSIHWNLFLEKKIKFMVKFRKTYQLTISILQIEGCYFTRTSLQVFFTDFDGNFKSTNKNPGSTFLKQNILRLLLGTKISYFRRFGLMKCYMAKCYAF